MADIDKGTSTFEAVNHIILIVGLAASAILFFKLSFITIPPVYSFDSTKTVFNFVGLGISLAGVTLTLALWCIVGLLIDIRKAQ